MLSRSSPYWLLESARRELAALEAEERRHRQIRALVDAGDRAALRRAGLSELETEELFQVDLFAAPGDDRQGRELALRLGAARHRVHELEARTVAEEGPSLFPRPAPLSLFA